MRSVVEEEVREGESKVMGRDTKGGQAGGGGGRDKIKKRGCRKR